MSGETIYNLVDIAIKELQKIGLSPSTIRNYEQDGFARIVRYFEAQGISKYRPEILRSYIEDERVRLERKEIQLKRFRQLELSAKRIEAVANQGKLEWNVKLRGSEIPIRPESQMLLEDYLTSCQVAASTKCGRAAIIRRYLSFAENHNKSCPTMWDAELVKQFICDAMAIYINSKAQAVSVLRGFLAFLSSNGKILFDFESALIHPATPHRRVLPCFTRAEIQKILDSIDTESAVGKRDYAIILLSASTGLRAVDIAFLKLMDIDYERHGLHITQQKTSHPLTLPVEPDVIAAINDYIKCGRPASKSSRLFLREYAPYCGFHDGHAIGHLFRRRLKAAGLEKQNGDGRSVHALRRTLGTQLVMADVPVTTVSQILGHSSPDAVKRYISLDDLHLKHCSLTLSGIEMTRKEFIEHVPV